MTGTVMLAGAIGAHRRGRILQEALSAVPSDRLADGFGVLTIFAEEFQAATPDDQKAWVEWTRKAGRALLLVPPFSSTRCDRPVPWWAERLDSAPRGGEGIAKVLAGEVTHGLAGKLQAPPLPGATWPDLSVSTGIHRLHPASGVFAVTCLPLWSLAVLDHVPALQAWFEALVGLSGKPTAEAPKAEVELGADHYGLLVFLLSGAFTDEGMALAALAQSPIFRISSEQARQLLKDLRDRGLVTDAKPTDEAAQLVMKSPYAVYLEAIREVRP